MFALIIYRYPYYFMFVKAQHSVQQCKAKSEKLEGAHGKLELISAELDKQFHVTMLHWLIPFIIFRLPRLLIS